MVLCVDNCFSLTPAGFARDDAVYEELKKPDEQRQPLPVDDDLPGMGQYYCVHCEWVLVFVFEENFRSLS